MIFIIDGIRTIVSIRPVRQCSGVMGSAEVGSFESDHFPVLYRYGITVFTVVEGVCSVSVIGKL